VSAEDESRNRLIAVTLDERTLGLGTPDQQHERAVAIYDLIERNHFELPGRDDGPYALNITLIERKLSLDIQREDGSTLITHLLSLTPFGRIIRDYEMVCDSYYAAIRTSTPAQIEAIDMGRRGLHDEAAWVLVERLEGKVRLNHDTARRLFTLIFALHWKG
jgi:uncharacterized protein (UPF0262 family)